MGALKFLTDMGLFIGQSPAFFALMKQLAQAADAAFAGAPVAGFFAAGEIGPVGGRAHLHGFTATLAVFGP